MLYLICYMLYFKCYMLYYICQNLYIMLIFYHLNIIKYILYFKINMLYWNVYILCFICYIVQVFKNVYIMYWLCREERTYNYELSHISRPLRPDATHAHHTHILRLYCHGLRSVRHIICISCARAAPYSHEAIKQSKNGWSSPYQE